jgi:orotate phosphoribosyltransferase-like protein
MHNYFAKYIKRDSNPNRKYAFIIDGFGKIDNLSDNLYNDFSIFIKNNLNIDFNEKVVFLGPSESGILLSKWVYDNINLENKIYIHTTLRSKILHHKYLFKFNENHCTNNNIHYFTFNANQYNDYKTIVVIEDEITSGNTIINLINSVKEHFNKIYIFTLLDNRDNENIIPLFPTIDIKIYSFNLKLLSLEESLITNNYINNNINIDKRNIFFIIGECSEKCYEIYKEKGDLLRFIPATKYIIDNINIYDIVELGDDNNKCSYYYYNPFKINSDANIYIYVFTTQYNIAQNLIKYIKETNVLNDNNIHINELLCNQILDNYNLLKFDREDNDDNQNKVDIDKLSNIIDIIVNDSSNNEILIISSLDTNNTLIINKLIERKLNVKVEVLNIKNMSDLKNILDDVFYIFPECENIWLLDDKFSLKKFWNNIIIYCKLILSQIYI